MRTFICLFAFVFMNLSMYGEEIINREITFHKQSKEQMQSVLRDELFPDVFFISADKVHELTKRYGLEVEDLLQMLVPIARSYARPPISNYQVGVAVLGKSGNIYLGVNLEFLGIPLNEVVHAEQFAITNARSHGETELIALAGSAAPCGICRQFLNEMAAGENLQILIPGYDRRSLSSLLPDSFGPKDLGLAGNLLTIAKKEPSIVNESSPLITKATEAAYASYAPYTDSKSGVAIKLKDGKIYSGSYLENAAYTPSISPLQTALIQLVADMREYSEISEVVLVEKLSAIVSQEIMAREILRNIAPEATFNVRKRGF